MTTSDLPRPTPPLPHLPLPITSLLLHPLNPSWMAIPRWLTQLESCLPSMLQLEQFWGKLRAAWNCWPAKAKSPGHPSRLSIGEQESEQVHGEQYSIDLLPGIDLRYARTTGLHSRSGQNICRHTCPWVHLAPCKPYPLVCYRRCHLSGASFYKRPSALRTFMRI